MESTDAQPNGAWPIRTALALAGACAAGHVAFLIAGSPAGWDTVVNVWLYNGALVLCGVTCLLRASLSRTLRGAWLAFGLGLLAWSAGDVYWVLELEDLRRIPYPSPADVGYLAALPCFFVGVALMIRQRVGRLNAASWIDGISASLAAAAVGVAFLGPALVDLTSGDPAAVMTNLAYPLGDLMLVAFLVGGVVVSGLRGTGPLFLIGAGMLVWTGADAIYLYLEATSSYNPGWLDALWPSGALLLALSASFSIRHGTTPRTIYRSPLWAPALIAGASAGLLVGDHFKPIHEAAVWLAGAALLGVAARLAASISETDRLMAALRHETITDALTGLANRRRLIADLEDAVGHPSEPPATTTLALFDLDGFKAYNDAFGHPAGDAMLRRLGKRLGASVNGAGTAYRLGGDEFCILVPSNGQPPLGAIERARTALGAKGEGFTIGASCGHVELSSEVISASDALRVVDHRMYAEKERRSSRFAHQTHELLLRIIREREPALGEHLEGVTRDAIRMARALSFNVEELDVIGRAAQLHDIGKIAIPEEVLAKPGPLDRSEWELMRRHTLIGARILGTAPALRPVAEIVESSHERWDGGGYPMGRKGEEIPLGARIIFVCDAYDAMTSKRSYREPLSAGEALAELRRNAGSQFDPALVDLFLSLRSADPARSSTGRELAIGVAPARP